MRHHENQAHWPLAGRAASDLWRKRASRSSKLSLCRPLRPFRHIIVDVVMCEILSGDVFPLRDFLRTHFHDAGTDRITSSWLDPDAERSQEAQMLVSWLTIAHRPCRIKRDHKAYPRRTSLITHSAAPEP
jgi:hypothetical protein